MEVLNLDALLTPETPIEFQGVRYALRAPSEATATRFRSAQLKGARLVGDKIDAGVEQVIGSQAYLVSMCLFTEDGKPVLKSTVESWPAQVVAKLFKLASATIDRKESEEDLERQVKEAQERLDALRNGRSEEADAKN